MVKVSGLRGSSGQGQWLERLWELKVSVWGGCRCQGQWLERF